MLYRISVYCIRVEEIINGAITTLQTNGVNRGQILSQWCPITCGLQLPAPTLSVKGIKISCETFLKTKFSILSCQALILIKIFYYFDNFFFYDWLENKIAGRDHLMLSTIYGDFCCFYDLFLRMISFMDLNVFFILSLWILDFSW